VRIRWQDHFSVLYPFGNKHTGISNTDLMRRIEAHLYRLNDRKPAGTTEHNLHGFGSDAGDVEHRRLRTTGSYSGSVSLSSEFAVRIHEDGDVSPRLIARLAQW
jgi:hypothetical protein